MSDKAAAVGTMGKRVLPPEVLERLNAMPIMGMRVHPSALGRGTARSGNPANLTTPTKVRSPPSKAELDQCERLMASERQYLTTLITLRDVFVFPILSNRAYKDMLSQNPSVAVFLSSIDQLVTIHKKFLPDLEKWFKLWQKNPIDGTGIGQLFLNYNGLFRIYGNYYSNYWKALPVLQLIPKTAFDVPDGTDAPKLDVLSLKPVKQLLQYHIILNEIRKHITDGPVDLKNLDQAIEDITTLKQCIKEMLDAGKAESRTAEKGGATSPSSEEAASKKLNFSSDLMTFAPGKTLIKEGVVRPLKKFHSEQKLVLFEDMLLLIRISVLGYELEMIQQINQDSTVIESEDDEAKKLFCFCFRESAESSQMMEVCAPSALGLSDWIKAIQLQIDLIRVMSGLQPSEEFAALYSTEEGPPKLTSDDGVDRCMRGLEPFNVFRKKHHCNCCGLVVCQGCAFQWRKLPFRDPQELSRVCTECASRFDRGSPYPWKDSASALVEKSGDQKEADFVLPGLDGLKNETRLIVSEIIATERTYVRNLTILLEVFVLPLQSLSAVDKTKREAAVELLQGKSESSRTIKISSMMAVFLNNVGQIYTLNCEMLGDLENCLIERQAKVSRGESNESIESAVSRIFLKFGPLFRLYGQYTKNHEAAVNEFKQKSKLRAFANERREVEKARVGTQTLESYLIKPIQRVPRYELLLKQLIKQCENDSEDEKVLQSALNVVNSCMEHLNEVIAMHQGLEYLTELEKRLISKTPLKIVKPYQKLLMEGNLKVVDPKTNQKTFKFILLLDSLIQCSESLIGLNVVKVYSLEQMAVEDYPDSDKLHNCFILKSREGSQFLVAKDKAEKSLWFENLKKAIANGGSINTNAKATKTGSKVTRDEITETQDEVETFLESINFSKVATKNRSEEAPRLSLAPVLLPDVLQDSCHICNSKFSFLNRKHHCRNCGFLVCPKCSKNRGYVPKVQKNELVKVCDKCFPKLGEPPASVKGWGHQSHPSMNLSEEKHNDDGDDDDDVEFEDNEDQETNVKALPPAKSLPLTPAEGKSGPPDLSKALSTQETGVQSQPRRADPLQKSAFNLNELKEKMKDREARPKPTTPTDKVEPKNPTLKAPPRSKVMHVKRSNSVGDLGAMDPLNPNFDAEKFLSRERRQDLTNTRPALPEFSPTEKHLSEDVKDKNQPLVKHPRPPKPATLATSHKKGDLMRGSDSLELKDTSPARNHEGPIKQLIVNLSAITVEQTHELEGLYKELENIVATAEEKES
jgi:hypothetical protein